MYVIVEYITCVGLIGGFLALVFAGWLLLLGTHEALKRCSERESTSELHLVARPKESRAPIAPATLTDTNPLTATHLSKDHESPRAISP